MNKNYTLKELADIAECAAKDADKNSKESKWGSKLTEKERWGFIWRSVTKSILDSIGYEFPKDEEREVFERWRAGLVLHPEDAAFEAWKAGRKELRRALEIRDARTEQEHAAELEEPAWIPWEGGECPLPDTVKRWECRFRGGWTSEFDYIVRGVWHHGGHINDIVAYRVLEE